MRRKRHAAVRSGPKKLNLIQPNGDAIAANCPLAAPLNAYRGCRPQPRNHLLGRALTTRDQILHDQARAAVLDDLLYIAESLALSRVVRPDEHDDIRVAHVQRCRAILEGKRLDAESERHRESIFEASHNNWSWLAQSNKRRGWCLAL